MKHFLPSNYVINLIFESFYVSSDGKTVEVNAQLVIGADGARSVIRNEMMKKPRYHFLNNQP